MPAKDRRMGPRSTGNPTIYNDNGDASWHRGSALDHPAGRIGVIFLLRRYVRIFSEFSVS